MSKSERKLWKIHFLKSFDKDYREYGFTQNDREELFDVYLDLRKNWNVLTETHIY